MQSEIDDVVGNQRTVSYADRLQMPFTQAFINEVYRIKTVAPLGVLRRYGML